MIKARVLVVDDEPGLADALGCVTSHAAGSDTRGDRDVDIRNDPARLRCVLLPSAFSLPT